MKPAGHTMLDFPCCPLPGIEIDLKSCYFNDVNDYYEALRFFCKQFRFSIDEVIVYGGDGGYCELVLVESEREERSSEERS